MKKHITRTMSVMLAVIMLMALLPTSAFAFSAYDYIDGGFYDEVKNMPQNIHVPSADLYGGTKSSTVIEYLNQLSKYMPHVTEAQRTNVTNYPYRAVENDYIDIKAVTDVSLLPTLEQVAIANPESIIRDINYNYESNSKPFGTYNEQGVLTERFIADVIENIIGTGRACNISPRVEKLFSDGRFVSMATGGKEVDAEGISSAISQTDIFLADSLRNDTLLRNVYLNYNVSYYGENTFRNSALETVVFPRYWYSDHNAYGDNHQDVRFYLKNGTGKHSWVMAVDVDNNMPLGVRNNLLFGKNANIIEANAFADCANLKSVIMPCEPAHLYIADGVFANCPKLTVYGPAGGTLESYCKANGIKFQAISEASIEEPLDSSIAPKMWAYHEAPTGRSYYESALRYYRYTTIANRVVSADNTDNYPNAIGIVDYATMNGEFGRYRQAVANAACAALNRYRSAEVNAKEVFDTHNSGAFNAYSY